MRTLFRRFATILLVAHYPSALYGETVPSEHRACTIDADCSIISLACCPCANGNSADAVNTRFAEIDEHQCTQDEIQTGARRGACAQKSVPVPVCRNLQ